jgi:membrane fusion protein (multidrug efflux system)
MPTAAAASDEAQPDARSSPVPDSSPRKKEPNDKAEGLRPGAKKPLSPRKRALLIGGATILVLAGAGYWYHGTFFEDTDDAQIDGYISSISSRVAGTVLAVNVEDNQPVTPNQLLVALDPIDLRVARDQARAALAQAQAQLRAEQSGASVSETTNETLVATSSSDVVSSQAGVAEARQAALQAASQIKQAEADAQLAEQERARAGQLLQSGSIARAEYDSRVAAADAASAKLEAARQGVEAAHRRVDELNAKARAASSRLREAEQNAPDVLEGKRATVELRKASVDAAQAAFEQSELNLGYARITAPVRGIVGKRSVNVGDRVIAGQTLLGITQIDKLWVTANFRETQVRKMQVGQHATVHVDAVGRDFEAEVESFAAATGSRYSVLPPENASGNYVKVVQRLPVRLRLLRGQAGLELLRPGMSVEPQVRVK